MVAKHCLQRANQRKIKIDLKQIEELCLESNNVDSAYIIGEGFFWNKDCWIILIIRNNTAVTIEPRRKSQSLTIEALKVSQLLNII